jgi:hypothetical protein
LPPLREEAFVWGTLKLEPPHEKKND